MELLDDVLLTNEPEPPMRSLNGWPVEVELQEPIGFHELTAGGSNDDEAAQSRLPPPKAYMLTPHNVCTLALLIERYTRFWGKNANGDKYYKRLDSPFVKHFLENKKSKLPRVGALMTMPIVLPDGKLLAKSGLDRALKTMFCIDPAIIQCLPQGDITDDQIAEAMRFLTDEWFADVLTDYMGKCTLIALALSVLERQLLGERPAFLATAGKRATGKTTAVTMVSLALTGKRAPAAAWSPNEEERRKAVFAAFLQSLPFIVWDNVKRGTRVTCPTIEKTLTAEELEDRILCTSRRERAPCTTIQVFTGNNIEAAGDMASRSLKIRLTTDRPDPENRTFQHSNPFEWTLAHRGKIIKALYTILLGNPRFKVAPRKREVAKTRFKQWWHLVGAPIEHAAWLASEEANRDAHTEEENREAWQASANYVDFSQAFRDTEAGDEESSSLAEVLAIMGKKSGWNNFRASQVAKWMVDGTDDGEALKGFFVEREGFIPSAKAISVKLKAQADTPVWLDTATLTLRWEFSKHDKAVSFKVEHVVPKATT